MRIIVLLVLVLGTVGCGAIGRSTAQLTGYSRQCVDGVSYLQFTSGATVEYNRDGKIKTCD